MRTQTVLMFGLMCLFIVSMGMSAHAGLVGYWPFNEGSGDVTADLAGDNDGILVDGPQWMDGLDGSGLQFDPAAGEAGIGSYVDTTGLEDLGSADFTAMAWFNIPAEALDGTKILLCTGSCCNNEAGFYIALRGGGDMVFALTDTAGGGPETSTAGGSDLADGEWHHVAGTYVVGGMASLYLDGEFIGEVDLSAWTDEPRQ